MIHNILLNKYLTDRYCSFTFISLLLLPLLISCSSSQNNEVEIITLPIPPKEFSSIPEKTENPKLLTLINSDEKINNISAGRKNPFLPPNIKDELTIPSTFKYHGQISSANTLNAFVSYEDRTGIVKKGDTGGESTDLLPLGWTVLGLDINTKVLVLGFEDLSIPIELFSQK